MRLLLVEDHVPLADELMAGLNRQGYAVDWLADGRDAVYQGRSEPYDLIILDLGLPGLPGLEVLTQWRAAGLATPVLIGLGISELSVSPPQIGEIKDRVRHLDAAQCRQLSQSLLNLSSAKAVRQACQHHWPLS